MAQRSRDHHSLEVHVVLKYIRISPNSSDAPTSNFQASKFNDTVGGHVRQFLAGEAWYVSNDHGSPNGIACHIRESH
jgi:hypothetical protein